MSGVEDLLATQLLAMGSRDMGVEPLESVDAAVDAAKYSTNGAGDRCEKEKGEDVLRPSDDLSSVLDLDADSCSICLDPFTEADPAIVSMNYQRRPLLCFQPSIYRSHWDVSLAHSAEMKKA